jgi:hypothetical protein
MRWTTVSGAILSSMLLLAAGAEPAQAESNAAAPRVVLGTDFSWGYRKFLDSEPSTSSKRYNANGAPGFGIRAEAYPLPALGLTFNYARAVGLKSNDVDTNAQLGTEWWRISGGLKLRLLGIKRVAPVALSLTAGVERHVFEFDTEGPPVGAIPSGRYTLAFAGLDERVTYRRVAFLAAVQGLYPLSKADFGDRTPDSGGIGFRARGGVAWAPAPHFALDASAEYTWLTFHLPSLPLRHDQRGTVYDRYLVISLGATVGF